MNSVMELIENAPDWPWLFAFSCDYCYWFAGIGLLGFILSFKLLGHACSPWVFLVGMGLLLIGLVMGGATTDAQTNCVLHDSEFEDAICEECNHDIVTINDSIKSSDGEYTYYIASVGCYDRTLVVRVSKRPKLNGGPVVVAANDESTTACLPCNVREACIEAVNRYELYK